MAGIAAATLCWLLLPGRATATDSLAVTAALAPDGSTATGELLWTVHNTGDGPLEAAELFLYPESYTENPHLDDIVEPRVYPGSFDPGGQVLHCPHRRTDRQGVPIAELTISPPIPPGGEAQLRCAFTTTIPRKFGSFGRSRDSVTLNGGLHPHPLQRSPTGAGLHSAPPAAVQHQLEIDAPGWSLVVGGHLPPERPPSMVPDAVAVPGDRPQSWITVIARKKLQYQNLPLDDGRSITFVGKPLKPRQKRWLRKSADDLRNTLESVGADLPDRGLILVEAPLRRRLVEVGSDGVLLVSDRFLEVSELFWRYHDLHFARAILADLIREDVRRREDPELAAFSHHGISWQLLPRYVEVRWKNHVELAGLVRRFSFLPQVDSLLQAPVFPFADQIFDNPRIVDPLRADISRFNRPLRSGRTLFIDLADRVGERSLTATAEAWVSEAAAEDDFYTLVLARTGIPVDAVARRWLEPPPVENLRVESVERSRDEEGTHLTRITVARDTVGASPSDQPVEIVVKGGPRQPKARIRLSWEGTQPVASWELRTAGRTGAVQIDPRGRILEIDEEGISVKRDNRQPRQLKVSGYGYILALDATSAGIEAYGALNFRPEHDNQRHLIAHLFADPEVRLGGGLSYVYYFGPRRLGSYRRHRIVGSWDFDWLDTRFRPTSAPLLSEFRFSYVYENRTTTWAPTRGQRISVTAFVGKDIALQDDAARPLAESGYVGVDATGITIVRLHPWHALAFRARLGLVRGNVVHRKFALGGASGLRGVPVEHIRGSFRGSVTAEWRHFFARDLDVQMPMSRLRAIQGSLFVQGGAVTDDLAAGPEMDQVAVSIGYGIRAFGDWLGVLPAIGGVEIAWSPNVPQGRIPLFVLPAEQWPRVPFQVYIVGSQSF